ncbi:hypothetical protein LINGRAPRIM_LOCUS1771 [Linum grandiflorum]
MSSFHDILASLVRSHVLYINDNMRSSKHQAHYLEFIDRPILPAVRVDPVAFGKYGLNPCTLLANLGWSTLVMNQSYSYYPDVVRQFYVNLRLEGRLQDGRFSTIIDGYRIVVTPHLLEVVLGLPPGGKQIFEETDLLRIGFSPSVMLGRWTQAERKPTDLGIIYDLPDYLKIVHYFITRICLPRSDSLYLVNGMDIWLLYCAIFSEKTDFSCLMFASLVKHSNPSFSGALPFGPAISYLLDALGLPLRSKYLLESPLDIFRPRHVLREVGWKPSQLVYGSGGELQSCNDLNASDDEIDTLADEMERSLQIQSALEAAANENFDD